MFEVGVDIAAVLIVPVAAPFKSYDGFIRCFYSDVEGFFGRVIAYSEKSLEVFFVFGATAEFWLRNGVAPHGSGPIGEIAIDIDRRKRHGQGDNAVMCRRRLGQG